MLFSMTAHTNPSALWISRNIWLFLLLGKLVPKCNPNLEHNRLSQPLKIKSSFYSSQSVFLCRKIPDIFMKSVICLHCSCTWQSTFKAESISRLHGWAKHFDRQEDKPGAVLIDQEFSFIFRKRKQRIFPLMPSVYSCWNLLFQWPISNLGFPVTVCDASQFLHLKILPVPFTCSDVSSTFLIWTFCYSTEKKFKTPGIIITAFLRGEQASGLSSWKHKDMKTEISQNIQMVN